ncbi:putative NRPS-like protein biosynthetic cluster [Amphichorda felina]
MASHLANGRCHAIFTCRGLASTSVQAAEKASIPLERVYTLPLPEAYIVPDDEPLKRFVSLEQLIDDASQIDPLEPLQWEPGQAKTQVAFLCPTSGTSGPQKLAMLTHYGVMLNILQVTAYEDYSKQGRGQVASGAIPFSHSYGLLIGHIALWRRDTLIVFPQFDMQHLLRTVSEFNITRLYLVPPILAALAANPFLLQMFDLSSVESVVTGAAPFDRAVAEKLHKHVPGWKFLHAYGLTETSIVATFTSAHDIWHGSSGSLVTGYQMRLVGPDGKDVSEYEEAGEVLFKAPNLFVGYLGNAKATKATIDPEGWHSTGDVGLVRVSPSGHEHLFIRDRIKDMIKVKGIQVVPIDIESVLREHPGVAEAAVIGIPDELAGERCCAFVVRSKTAMSEMEEDDLRDSIDDHVEEKLHETHWLSGRIHFLAEIPKSKNGKVLKKELRALGK